MGIGSGNGQFNFGGGTLAAISTISVPMPITLTGLGAIATNGTGLFSGQISGPGGIDLLRLRRRVPYPGGFQHLQRRNQIKRLSGRWLLLGPRHRPPWPPMAARLTCRATASLWGVSAAPRGTVTNNGFVLAELTISQTGTASFGGAIQDGAAQTVLVLSGGTGTLVLTGTNPTRAARPSPAERWSWTTRTVLPMGAA